MIDGPPGIQKIGKISETIGSAIIFICMEGEEEANAGASSKLADFYVAIDPLTHFL